MYFLLAQVSLRMLQYFGDDLKRINHALKVHGFAQTIGGLEGLDESARFGLAAGALLHDIGIKNAERKYNSTAGKYQEQEGPGVARDLLAGLPLTAAQLERICFLIGHHHTSGEIDGLDLQILVEADFLVNAFEDAMSPEQIRPLQARIFRTPSGTALLQSLYRC